MNDPLAPQRVVIVSEGQDQALVSGLRQVGHEVSVVGDLAEAEILLASRGFDYAALPAEGALALLRQSTPSEVSEMRAWRLAIKAASEDLNSLLQRLQTLTVECESDSDSIADTGRAIAQTTWLLREHLADLTEDQRQELTRRVVGLQDVVEAAALVAYPAAADRKQGLSIHIDAEVSSVRADEGKLRRVLSKLLEQASRESARSGKITVRATRDEKECVISVAHEGGPTSLLELRDLFNPSDGTMNGLAWVHRLVTQQRARLWVESQSGDATTVFLAIPDAIVAGAPA